MGDFDQFNDGVEENLAINNEAIQDDVAALLRAKLGGEEWSPVKVDLWTDDIISSILKDLAEMKRPFKYVVNCVIMQRTGAPLSVGFISLWDNTKDGMVHVPFENETITCTTTVYFVKID